MRIIVTVLALACGSALASQSATGTDRPASMDRDRAAVVSTDTQAMGATRPSSDSNRGDRSRQARMDDAYDTWKSKQK